MGDDGSGIGAGSLVAFVGSSGVDLHAATSKAAALDARAANQKRRGAAVNLSCFISV